MVEAKGLVKVKKDESQVRAFVNQKVLHTERRVQREVRVRQAESAFKLSR